MELIILHDVAREFSEGTEVSFMAVYCDAAFRTCRPDKKFSINNVQNNLVFVRVSYCEKTIWKDLSIIFNYLNLSKHAPLERTTKFKFRSRN